MVGFSQITLVDKYFVQKYLCIFYTAIKENKSSHENKLYFKYSNKNISNTFGNNLFELNHFI